MARWHAIIVLGPIGAALMAQQTEVRCYDLEDGLPQSMVNHVLQDSDGFVWLGTGDGLARFDGLRMIAYKHDPRSPTSISANGIWGIAQRDANHLWVGTRHGLDVLDTRSGRFARVRTGLPAGQDGCWRALGTHGGQAVFYSPLSSAVLRIGTADTLLHRLRHEGSYALHFDARSGELALLIDPDTLLVLRPDGTERIHRLPLQGRRKFHALVPWRGEWLVLSDRDAILWSEGRSIGALPEGLQLELGRSGQVKRAALDEEGRLWLATAAAGILVAGGDMRVERRYPLRTEAGLPLSLTCIAFDRQGNTWVGTDGQGVCRIAPQTVRFGRCMPGQGLPWEPPNWLVRGFAQWDGHRVLVSFHQGGLALFDERAGTLSPLVLPAASARVLAGRDLMRPFTDPHGLVWMQDRTAAFALDPHTGEVVHTMERPWTIAVVQDPEGYAVSIDRWGVNRLRWNGRTLEASPVDAPAMLAHMEGSGGVPFYTAIDRHGRFILSPRVGDLTVWKDDARIALSGIPDGVRMLSARDDAEGNLWLCTDDGLYRLNATSLSLTGHWTVHDGLPDQMLYGMLPDAGGGWWISSNNGLCRFDAKTSVFQPFTVQDGLQSKEFNSHAFLPSRSGRLYFGGVNGFNHFHPDEVRPDPDTPTVRMVALRLGDGIVEGTAPAPLHVDLSYPRNSVHIGLAVLEMSAPERNRYRYRIAGYSDWAERPAGSPLEIINLPDGDWTVEAIGINAHGLASDPVQLLTLHVPLPFWASAWAYVLGGGLLAFLVGGTAFLFYRQRMRLRLAVAERRMEELRVRARIAQDLHDDVGSGLARITALARGAERLGQPGEGSREQMGKVSALSQELLRDLRDVVWMNDPQRGSLGEVLLRLKGHAHDLFGPTPATFTADLPEPLPERSIGGKARRTLYLVAKEALHNALKHSDAHWVQLVFRIDEREFRLEVIDDGRGLAGAAASADGHGLRNMRDRAAAIGCTVHIGSLPEGGTIVRLAGPLAALDL